MAKLHVATVVGATPATISVNDSAQDSPTFQVSPGVSRLMLKWVAGTGNNGADCSIDVLSGGPFTVSKGYWAPRDPHVVITLTPGTATATDIVSATTSGGNARLTIAVVELD